MNICAGFQLFALENEFADVLSDAIKPAGERCEIAMEKRQYSWYNQIASTCEREAFEEAGGVRYIVVCSFRVSAKGIGSGSMSFDLWAHANHVRSV